MALTVTDFDSALPYRMIVESDCGNTAQVAVRGACVLHMIEISGNNVGEVSVKLCDSVAATAGTTVPKLILYCRQNTDVAITIPGAGLPFDTGLSFFLTATPGVSGTAYSDDGSQAVLVKITTT